MDDLQQFFTAQSLFVIMVTESHRKRDFSFRYQIQHCTHSFFRRFTINHISRKKNKVGLFHIQYLIDTFDRYIRTRIIIDIMNIGKLDNLKLTVFVKLKSLLLCICQLKASQQDSQQ